VKPEPGKRVALIGPGRLGRALVRALYERGYRIEAVVGRRMASARRCADSVRCERATTELQEVPADCPLVLIATPDEVIAEVAWRLSQFGVVGPGTFAVHFSGALSSEVLSPLKQAGAIVFSIHPVQTFPGTADDWKRFGGIYFGIEGEEPGLAIAQNLVAELGGVPLVIPREAKGLYHAACTVASNYLVALLDAAAELLSPLGLPEEQASQVLMPLVRTTLENLEALGPSQALTGPIARGDLSTVEKHLQEIAARFPAVTPIYVALGERAAEMALERRRIAEEVFLKLKQRLRQAFSHERSW